MKIAVCIKQVPGTSQVEIDPVTGTLKRDGVEAKMNPYDLYAIETALRLKERTGAVLSALTMGPPQAEEVVREAFMMGADEGFLLTDRRFGGADVLATSRTISQGLRAAGPFDLIVCGKQTTDGDTAQVGAEVAEFLGIPHVSNVCRIRAVHSDSLELDLDMPLSIETVRVPFPCLICVDKDIFQPRLPSFKRKLATADRPVKRISMDDLPDRDPAHYGLNGSPTRVIRIFPPENNNLHEMWRGPENESVEKLYNLLEAGRFLQKI